MTSSSLSFNDYQYAAAKVAIYPEAREGTNAAVNYTVLGLSNEAGEVSGKWKKVLRDDNGVISDEKREAILDEIGDVLWYAANLCSELDFPLELTARRNLEKLLSREARGVLGGSGDKR